MCGVMVSILQLCIPAHGGHYITVSCFMTLGNLSNRGHGQINTNFYNESKVFREPICYSIAIMLVAGQEHLIDMTSGNLKTLLGSDHVSMCL